MKPQIDKISGKLGQINYNERIYELTFFYAQPQPEPNVLTCKKMLMFLVFFKNAIHPSEIIPYKTFDYLVFLYIHLILERAFKIMIMIILEVFFLKLYEANCIF